jgi:hypothetical protein
MMWSKRHKCCRYCGTEEMKHKGRGLCVFCHREMWRYVVGKKKNDEMAPFFKEIYENYVSSWKTGGRK